MSDTTRAILLGVFTLSACIWVGGYVAIAVVARVARRALAPDQRVALFRGLGRSYGIVGSVALGTGAALLGAHAWDATLTAATVLAVILVLALAAGVAQARRMTRLRQTALAAPGDLRLARRVRRGARLAMVLRAALGMLTAVLIALGSLLAT